ncbi:hypothetical protein CY652_15110 [Burkholderia sp. WAC0059]|uniref:hypothetical protein n=1 Tax=Burkholderia sp. WAC0059 TaxID=2066022 RepID=UPI000C7F55DB|nr:hypothetical protein [Burkholderia sp. WAC0059]PLZ01698.1 hypothetical protein CY652_15110 [Burkholderia sp. WAC0059]
MSHSKFVGRGVVREIGVCRDRVVLDLACLRSGSAVDSEGRYVAMFSADQIHELISKLNQSLLEIEADASWRDREQVR